MSVKLTKKQLSASKALERRKQRRRLESQFSDENGNNTSSSLQTTITNEMLDELSLQNNLSRIISLLPGSKRKRPPPIVKDNRPLLYRKFPLPSLKKFTPWYTDPSDSLTDELTKFSKYVGLDASETAARKQLIDDVTEAITSKWPQSIVNVFGSFPVGLSTFLSDIDVSILGMGVDDPNGVELESMMAAPPSLLSDDHSPKKRKSEDGDEDDSDDKAKESEAGDNIVSWEVVRSGTVVTSSSSSAEEEMVSWEIDRVGLATVAVDNSENNAVETSLASSSSQKVSMSPKYEYASSDEDDDSIIFEGVERKRRKVEDLDEDLCFNTTSNITEEGEVHEEDGSNVERPNNRRRKSASPAPPSALQLENLKRQTALLRVLFSHLRVMDWMAEGEFRSKAKVPIIYITHRSSISCDISMGVTAQDTTDLVHSLKAIDADAFVVLASFLKVFLFLLSLDKPFCGGIGSYKLYVLIGFILNMRREQSPKEKDHGLLLLRFVYPY